MTTNWNSILETCVAIREFEVHIQELYKSDLIQSPVHLSIGQELICGIISNYSNQEDHFIGNYRSHGLSLALSSDYNPIILELLAKRDGVSGGKAGSMHLSVPCRNMPWTSAIVGSGVPLSVGIADSLKRDNSSGIALVQFGDGALEEGCVMESLNLASVLSVPLLFVLEDNSLAIHTPKEKRTSIEDYLNLSKSFGIESFDASYKDPLFLDSQYQQALNYVRTYKKPAFIRVECYRWLEHVGVDEDWHLGYRDKSELYQWKNCDIISNPGLVGISYDCVAEWQSKYRTLFKDRFRELSLSDDPSYSDLLNNVI